MKPLSIAFLLFVAMTVSAARADGPQQDGPKQDGPKQMADAVVASRVVDVWEKIPAWNAPTEPETDTTKPDANKVAGKRVIRLGNVAKPELHLFPATGDDCADTTVVIAPGGGYSILAWDLEGTEVAQWLNSIGVSAAVLKYRVPTRSEAQNWLPAVQDIQRSISLIRSGAMKELPAKQIGVLGFSAGGNAAARSATAPKRFYDASDSSDEASFLPDFGVLVYPAWLVQKDDASKLIDDLKVTSATPPMFFAHARDDRVTCMSSVTLFAQLQRHNIAASLHVFADGGHGFGLRPNGTSEDRWPLLCESWMRSQGWLTK